MPPLRHVGRRVHESNVSKRTTSNIQLVGLIEKYDLARATQPYTVVLNNGSDASKVEINGLGKLGVRT